MALAGAVIHSFVISRKKGVRCCGKQWRGMAQDKTWSQINKQMSSHVCCCCRCWGRTRKPRNWRENKSRNKLENLLFQRLNNGNSFEARRGKLLAKGNRLLTLFVNKLIGIGFVRGYVRLLVPLSTGLSFNFMGFSSHFLKEMFKLSGNTVYSSLS